MTMDIGDLVVVTAAAGRSHFGSKSGPANCPRVSSRHSIADSRSSRHPRQRYKLGDNPSQLIVKIFFAHSDWQRPTSIIGKTLFNRAENQDNAPLGSHSAYPSRIRIACRRAFFRSSSSSLRRSISIQLKRILSFVSGLKNPLAARML
jgi:hypothetical protein